jgi:hypothetical protein
LLAPHTREQREHAWLTKVGQALLSPCVKNPRRCDATVIAGWSPQKWSEKISQPGWVVFEPQVAVCQVTSMVSAQNLDPVSRTSLVTRLKSIEGQAWRIQRMFEGGPDCQ